MSILVDKSTKVIIQGITGKTGALHAKLMKEYAIEVKNPGFFVGGVTPGKGGETVEGLPVFNSVAEAIKKTKCNTSCIFVPPPFAADSIIEAVDAGIKLVIVITEGIPVLDMMKVKAAIKGKDVTIVGPNCPGVITPGIGKIGIMPGFIHKAGKIGVVSRSGTLTYEAVDQLTKAGLGESTCVGIGGDPINGSQFLDVVKLFAADPKTEGLVFIGEIGGDAEETAAEWLKANYKKPVVGFIAGQSAPPGRRMGHAGAIVGGGDRTASQKSDYLAKCGMKMVKSPTDIGAAMTELFAKQSKTAAPAKKVAAPAKKAAAPAKKAAAPAKKAAAPAKKAAAPAKKAAAAKAPAKKTLVIKAAVKAPAKKAVKGKK